jgi:hypothetical protein
MVVQMHGVGLYEVTWFANVWPFYWWTVATLPFAAVGQTEPG